MRPGEEKNTMRTLIIGVMSLHGVLALAPTRSLAADAYPTNPDVKVYLHIETSPQPAEILACGGDATQEVVLGRSPHVALVACTWPSGVFSRKWQQLKLWSSAGICRSDYDPATKTYELDARFLVRASGHASKTVDVHVATLAPGSVDWEHVPEVYDRTFTVELEPLKSAAAPGEAIRTAVVASKNKGDTENPGSVVVESDVPQAQVSIDGSPVGMAPVRLLLGPGSYTLQVSKAGHEPDTRTLTVEPGSKSAVRASMKPSPGAL
jgi:hypothetical protein